MIEFEYKDFRVREQEKFNLGHNSKVFYYSCYKRGDIRIQEVSRENAIMEDPTCAVLPCKTFHKAYSYDIDIRIKSYCELTETEIKEIIDNYLDSKIDFKSLASKGIILFIENKYTKR